MTIPLTGTGGFFTREGVIFGGNNEIQNLINGTLGTRANTIEAQYASTDQQLPSALYSSRDSYRSGNTSLQSYYQSLAQSTLLQMAIDDGTGINPSSLLQALIKLRTQMIANAASINQPTISATVTNGGSNTGNGALFASLIDPDDGKQMDYVFAETMTGTITGDAYTGGTATAKQEPLQIIGQIPANVFDFNYPQGSGCNLSLNAVNPSLTSGLILLDGDFENWGGAGNNTPSSWDSTGGTPGTTILRGASQYTGSFDMNFVGNGAELTTIRQVVSLQPLTSYGFVVWMKADAGITGTVRMRLVDGSNTVINNANSTANSFTQNTASLTTSYVAVGGYFQTPAVLPAVTKMEIGLSVAINNTHNLHMDRAALIAGTRTYGYSSPFVVFVSGSTNFAKNDTISIAIANNNTITTFSRQLDRFLGLRSLGYKIPSSGAPTINDNLIT
jgi:hypothetical protein